MIYIDFLTAFVAAIIGFIIINLWFSQYCFKKLWEKYRNFKLHLKTTKAKIIFFIFVFIFIYIIALFLAFVQSYLRVTSFWDGIITGFLMWFGFTNPFHLASIFLFAKKNKFKIYLVEGFLFLLVYLLMGGMLAG
jgi:hypothetical protein